MSERIILESEVSLHRTRLEELAATLRDIEDNLLQAGSHPEKLLREASLLRLEARGREAAVEIGAARLKMLRD
jgi:hypothetical protein